MLVGSMEQDVVVWYEILTQLQHLSCGNYCTSLSSKAVIKWLTGSLPVLGGIEEF